MCLFLFVGLFVLFPDLPYISKFECCLPTLVSCDFRFEQSESCIFAMEEMDWKFFSFQFVSRLHLIIFFFVPLVSLICS